MERDIRTIDIIQREKEKDIERAQKAHDLDPEGTAMGEHKRFTLDLVDIPTDPLR